MKDTIAIFDILGIHCGMHYYDIAFSKILRERGYNPKIYSNFKEYGSDKIFFPNFYTCNKFVALLLFVYAYIKFLVFVLFSHNIKIVYLAYGELYELPFIIIAGLSRMVYIDVHEIHALKYEDTSKIARMFEYLYRNNVYHVIYHSERTYNILKNGKTDMLYVPHFKYVFKKEYEVSNLSYDVMTCFQSKCRKFLFFGNLSIVKGIDTIMKVFNNLKKENGNWELAVAGKNVENIDFSTFHDKRIKILNRHINDDELVYLYANADYILLPYKKSSQSGIFAMAAYFHKPMILSDIPYFRDMIKKYPSFGIVRNVSSFENIVRQTIHDGIKQDFYAQEDCYRFEMKQEIDSFVEKFMDKKHTKQH